MTTRQLQLSAFVVAVVVAAVVAAACGEERPPSQPAPPPPRVSPPTESTGPGEKPIEQETAAAPAGETGSGGLLVLGGDDRGVVVLHAATGQVERFDVGEVSSVRWHGCGDRIAYHTPAGRVHVMGRDGAEIASRPLPDLVAAHGDRLVERIARVWNRHNAEEITDDVASTVAQLRASGDLDEFIQPGRLARTTVGGLAMDPVIDIEFLNGEEVGCRTLARGMRVHLHLPGVENAPCENPAREVVRMPRRADDAAPSGWRCRRHVPADGRDTSWAAVRSSVARVQRARGAWLVGEEDIQAALVCEPPGDPTRRTVSLYIQPYMGCVPAPPMFVVAGENVEADVGDDSKVLQYGPVRLYGGSRGWYAQLNAGALRPVGTVVPDVVEAED